MLFAGSLIITGNLVSILKETFLPIAENINRINVTSGAVLALFSFEPRNHAKLNENARRQGLSVSYLPKLKDETHFI